MAFTIELDLTGMTWGELRAFVKAGEAIPGADPVEYGISEYDQEVDCLRISGYQPGSEVEA